MQWSMAGVEWLISSWEQQPSPFMPTGRWGCVDVGVYASYVSLIRE